MNTLYIYAGFLWIIFGIAVKLKKWLWIHQGLYKRPVDVDKYTNYMGIVDIITGICSILLGVSVEYFNIPDGAFFLLIMIYLAFIVNGEFRYRKKSQ